MNRSSTSMITEPVPEIKRLNLTMYDWPSELQAYTHYFTLGDIDLAICVRNSHAWVAIRGDRFSLVFITTATRAIARLISKALAGKKPFSFHLARGAMILMGVRFVNFRNITLHSDNLTRKFQPPRELSHGLFAA